MRLAVLIFLVACQGGRSIPLQINTDTKDKAAVVKPVADLLNAKAGCQWLFLASEKPPAGDRVELLLSSKAIDEYNDAYDENKEDGICTIGYWSSWENVIVLRDRAPVDDVDSIEVQEKVLMHEIGHALGFEHSPSKESFMYPQMRSHLSIEDYADQLIQGLGGKTGLWTVCDRVKATINAEAHR